MVIGQQEGSLSVLLIEDTEGDVELIQVYLSEINGRQYTVSRAARLDDGIERARKEHPDVALVDLSLRDSGPETTIERLTEIPDEVAIVVLTGGPTDSYELQALQQGAEEFLDKSNIDSGMLERCLDHAVERRAIRCDLREHQRRLERYEMIVENTTDAVAIKDTEGHYRLVNEAFEELVGKVESELIGLTTSEVFGRETGEQVRQREREVIESGTVQSFEETVVTDQFERTLLTDRIPVYQDGELKGLIAIGRDITDRKQMRENLQKMALYDHLTGLPNRALFHDRLEQAVERAKRRGTPFAVGFVDLDGFEAVNDSFGRAAGDELMRKVANRLRTSTRSGDTVARVGGDEFIMLLDAVGDRQVLEEFGQRLCGWFEPPFRVCGSEIHLTASIGLVSPDPEELKRGAFENELEVLTRTANRAMYDAKQLAGTTWQIASPSEDSGGARQIQRANRIRDGIEHGEFLAHYQPIHRLEDRSIFAFELLARWRHPDRGLVSPGEFIPVAEKSALICELGEAVLRRACREMATLVDQMSEDRPLPLFVNLSPRQLERSESVERVIELVDQEAPPGIMVCFEVTETQLLEHLGRVVELRERGFDVLVDDFGTGYSSLSRLKEMPVDGLKIDMEFVHGITRETADNAIAQTVVRLGELLDIPVIAEGIETGAQFQALVEMDCEAGQGFWLNRPQSFEAVSELMT